MCDFFSHSKCETITVTKIYNGYGWKCEVIWEIKIQIYTPTEIWTGFTVQIVNHYTIKHHLCSHSLLFLLNQYNMTEPHYTVQLVLSCHIVVVSDSMRTTTCLIWHCKSVSLSQQIRAPPPLSSSSGLHYPQLSPPLWVRKHVLTHLFDRNIWSDWEIWKVTIGLSFGAASNNISEQKLATYNRRGLEEGSSAELQFL